MKKKIVIKKLFVFFPLFFLMSCGGSNSDLHLIGNYYLIPIEGENGKELGYKVNGDGDFVAIIKGNIIAVGHDNDYMIIKCTPFDSPITIHHNNDSISVKYSGSVKKNAGQDSIQYFIVPIYKTFTYSPEKGILGPLDLNEFNEKVKRLNINTEFTMNIN